MHPWSRPRLAYATEAIFDAAREMTRLVERGEELHPVVAAAIQASDEVSAEAIVEEGAPALGKTLKQLSVETETGMMVLAVQRGRRWIYRPRPMFELQVDDRLIALVQSTREALANAARHSGATSVSAYLEVEPDQVTVFVRDRGTGFDPDQVSRHRRGIADSIVGRMDRHGGKAVIRSEAGDGTEVELVMPR